MNRTTTILDMPIKSKSTRIRKSSKFQGAHMLSNRRGHYFMDDNKTLDNGKIAVQYVFYDGKWRQDTAWFEKEEFDSIVQQIH